MRHFRRYGLITFTLVALVYFLHCQLDLTMKSDLSYFRKAKQHIDKGEIPEAMHEMAEWYKHNRKATGDSRYTALVAEMASKTNDSSIELMGLHMTKSNVLAGK